MDISPCPMCDVAAATFRAHCSAYVRVAVGCQVSRCVQREETCHGCCFAGTRKTHLSSLRFCCTAFLGKNNGWRLCMCGQLGSDRCRVPSAQHQQHRSQALPIRDVEMYVFIDFPCQRAYGVPAPPCVSCYAPARFCSTFWHRLAFRCLALHILSLLFHTTKMCTTSWERDRDRR
jgi:hypothetical protein